MEQIGYYNLLAIVVGLAMIVTCSVISYLFQQHVFMKYRGKAATMAGTTPKKELRKDA